MAELPSHPEMLCFSEYMKDFLDKDFQVDEFIGKCRKKVSIECLRQDLASYYRTLKSAMVELINKDYADFVSLSSNLVGMDKSIANLMTPLGQLQEEIVELMIVDNDIMEEIGKMEEAETQAEQRWIECWRNSVDNINQLYAL